MQEKTKKRAPREKLAAGSRVKLVYPTDNYHRQGWFPTGRLWCQQGEFGTAVYLSEKVDYKTEQVSNNKLWAVQFDGAPKGDYDLVSECFLRTSLASNPTTTDRAPRALSARRKEEKDLAAMDYLSFMAALLQKANA